MMVEAGPGPLGWCPVRGVTEVEQDSQIWVANLRLHPVEIEENQVIATAECVMETPGTCPEDKGSGMDEVEGLVRRVAPHLNEVERRQLRVRRYPAARREEERGKGVPAWMAEVQRECVAV